MSDEIKNYDAKNCTFIVDEGLFPEDMDIAYALISKYPNDPPNGKTFRVGINSQGHYFVEEMKDN